jgi:hydroxylamine reductase (hybrid-cluster protein)
VWVPKYEGTLYGHVGGWLTDKYLIFILLSFIVVVHLKCSLSPLTPLTAFAQVLYDL